MIEFEPGPDSADLVLSGPMKPPPCQDVSLAGRRRNDMDRWEALSELVHEQASQIASDANNGGETNQIEFLLTNGWDRDEIETEVARRVTEDASEE